MLFKNKSKRFMFCLKLLLVLGIIAGFAIQFPVFQKKIIVSINGDQREVVLKGLYVSDLIDELNQQYGIDNYKFINDFDGTKLLADVENVTVATRKTVKIKSSDGEREFDTFARTLQELILEVNFEHTLDRPDVLTQKVQTDMMLEEKVIEESYEVEVRENPELDEGVENVIQEGSNKIVSQLFSLMNQNVIQLGNFIVNGGTKRIVEKGTKHISTAPPVPTDSIWDKLAFCESGGRWNINTGNGYYGGIQFSAPTWRTASRAVGLDIAYAHQASREEQILAATWLQKKSGWGQWPHCARKLGLI